MSLHSDEPTPIGTGRRGPSPMMFLSLGIGAAIAVTMISVVSYFTKGVTPTTTSTTVATSPLLGKEVEDAHLPPIGTAWSFAPGIEQVVHVPAHHVPTVVVFFASWCGPCAEELPRIAKWYSSKPNEIALEMVASNDSQTDANAFLKKSSVALPAALDADGSVASTNYGFGTLPETVFIDESGVVRKVVYGAVTAKDLRDGTNLLLSTITRN